MGTFLSKAWNALFSSEPCSIVMIGLDAAGKTTILYKLKINELLLKDFIKGFNVETVQYKNLSFTVWDVGGQTILRPFWRHYYSNAKAVIYVVDSCDSTRMEEARDELHEVWTADELRDAPVLIFANKQDMPNSMSTSDIAQILKVADLRNRAWYIQASSAPTGQGLYEGLDWLAQEVTKRNKTHG